MNPLVLFLLWPILEIAGFILVGDWLGLWPTLGLVVLAVVVGISLIRWQGLNTLRRAQEASARGELPVGAMLDSACIVIASFFLIIPGFLSDLLAILLLIRPLRRLIGGVILARAASTSAFRFQAARGSGKDSSFRYGAGARPAGGSGVIDGDFRDVTPQEAGSAGSPDGAGGEAMPRIEDSRWAQSGSREKTD